MFNKQEFSVFWSLFSSLGVCNASLDPLKQFAGIDHPEVFTPSFLFQCVVGIVNAILKKIKTALDKMEPSLPSPSHSRIRQLMQHKLYCILITFIINEYEPKSKTNGEQAVLDAEIAAVIGNKKTAII